MMKTKNVVSKLFCVIYKEVKWVKRYDSKVCERRLSSEVAYAKIEGRGG